MLGEGIRGKNVDEGLFDPESYLSDKAVESSNLTDGKAFLKSVKAHQMRHDVLIKQPVFHSESSNKKISERKVSLVDEKNNKKAVLEYAQSVMDKKSVCDIQKVESLLLLAVKNNDEREIALKLQDFFKVLAKYLPDSENSQVNDFLEFEKKEIKSLIADSNKFYGDLDNIYQRIDEGFNEYICKSKAFKILKEKKMHNIDGNVFSRSYGAINVANAKEVIEKKDTGALLTFLGSVLPFVSTSKVNKTALKPNFGLKNSGGLSFVNSTLQTLRTGISEDVMTEIKKYYSTQGKKEKNSDFVQSFFNLKGALESPSSSRSDISDKQMNFFLECKRYKNGNPVAILFENGFQDITSGYSGKETSQNVKACMEFIIENLGKTMKPNMTLQIRPIYTFNVDVEDKDDSVNEEVDADASVEDEKKSDPIKRGNQVSITSNISTLASADWLLRVTLPKEEKLTLQGMINNLGNVKEMDDFKIQEYHFDTTKYEVSTDQNVEDEVMEVIKNKVLNDPQESLKISNQEELIADEKKLQNVMLYVDAPKYESSSAKMSEYFRDSAAILSDLDSVFTIPIRDQQDQKLKEIPFRIKSVCLHTRDSNDSKHYVSAERLDLNGNQWRIYNDENVLDVNQEEISGGEYGIPHILITEKCSS